MSKDCFDAVPAAQRAALAAADQGARRRDLRRLVILAGKGWLG
ncbi:hypothetical protein [Bradyrhizobium lablabi]|nr:hypothetical protein [Bradyrhizobium lablabi]